MAVDDRDQAKNATESDSLGESSEDAQSQPGCASKGSRSKRRRQAKETFAKHRSNHWKARKVEKAKQRVRSASSSNRQGYYAKLRKSLYGLRRAAKLFNRGLRQLLKDNGYESCSADTCIFCKVSGTESILFNIHVDDFACYPTCDAMFDELCAVLRSKYEITVTDNLVKHLGMHVNEYENGSIGISQPKH